MKLTLALAVLTASFPLLSQTICSTKVLIPFDPHQSRGPLESYLASKLYLPFFSAPGSPGVVRSFRKVNNTLWELEISPDIAFQEFQGWKPKRKLNAQDVSYSIERQLRKFAKTVAAEESYIPAKLNGLEKNLISVRAPSATKVELTFRNPINENDLKGYFSFPTGIIVSRDYVESGKPTEFYPGYGKYEWKSVSPVRLVIQSRDKKETQDILFLRGDGLTFKKFQDRKCKRLYYPPLEMVKAAQAKKIPVTAVPISSSKLYFRFNPIFRFADEVSPLLTQALQPAAFPSLAGRNRTNQFFGKGTKTPSKVSKNLPGRTAYVYHCTFPELGEDELYGFQDDFHKTIKDTLKIDISYAPVNCDQLAGIRPAYDTLGVINTFEYRSQPELLQAFNCGTAEREIFGFCQGQNPKPEAIDRKISEMKRIYPIADLQSYLLEAF